MGGKLRIGWPVVLGAALTLLGLLGGLLSPVGEYCAGAFLPQDAAGAEDASKVGGTGTHYFDACVAAAGQQAVLWWGLVVLGLIVAAAALVWLLVLPAVVRERLRRSLALLGAGVSLLFVGVVGGWAVPVGANCSGAFGSQAPARVLAQVTGSSVALKACQSVAPAAALLWWFLILVGAALVIVAVMKALQFRWPRRARKPEQVRSPRLVPAWPLVLGALVMLGGVFFGNVIPVGPHCDGALNGGQMSAAGADIASAFAGDRTDYSATCTMLAGQMAGTYWGVIGFGAALVVLGMVLGRVLPLLAAAAAPGPASLAGEVRELAALRDARILTSAEFEAGKARLLGLPGTGSLPEGDTAAFAAPGLQ